MQRARGIGRLAARSPGDRTRLDVLYQEGCAKIRLPNTHRPGMEAVLINTAGGLTGGDRLDWDLDIGGDAELVVTTQACERVYRSTGPEACIETRLTAGPGARLDWLPQETILFERGHLRRSLSVDLAPGAIFTAIEAVLLGRDAMGEDARGARFSDSWRIRRDGRLIHAEATTLGGHDRERDGSGLLAGARAFATIVHCGPNTDRRLERIRQLTAGHETIGSSATADRLVVRIMAGTGLALRRLIVPILHDLSSAGALPRLWHS